jgi:hypothetical protein
MSQPNSHSVPATAGIPVTRAWRITVVLIIAAGIFLRLYHFLDNRSLWQDELFLASSLIRMDFHELATLPLDYYQRAPLGFLWAVKLCVHFFGNQEPALRLFPLCCGLLSLFAFVPVARHFLGPVGALIGLAMLAFAPPMVYHSVELKQYGTELLATILALGLYVRYRNRRDPRGMVVWGLGGAVLVWFSFTVLFVLAGIGLVVFFARVLDRDRQGWSRFLVTGALWLAGFGLSYWLVVANYAEEAWLMHFWERRQAFFPMPPAPGAVLGWLGRWLYTFVYYPLGLTWVELDYFHNYPVYLRVLARMPLLPLVLLPVGMVVLWRRNREHCLVLLAMVVVSFAASALRLYPLSERLNTFLAPVGILFIAAACHMLFTSVRRSPVPAYLITGLLLAAPIMNSARQVINTDYFGGYKKSYQREAWMYICDHYQPGDLVYVYWNDLAGWNYYGKAYHLPLEVLEGRDVRKEAHGFPDYFHKLAPDLEQFRNHKRVWVVCCRANDVKPGDVEGQPEWYYRDVDAVAELRRHLQTIGSEVETFRPEVSGWLDINVILYSMESR